MIRSHVRIEFTEEKSPGKFNVFADESGTIGENCLGQDLAFALEKVPRPLAMLAEAIVATFDRSNSSNSRHPLLKAAQAYLARWTNYDACVAQGKKPSDLPWPDTEYDERERTDR